MSPSGDQVFEFDPKSILSAFREMQKAMSDVEKGIVGGTERMNTAMEKFGRTVGTVNSRSQQSQERYLKSIEATSAAYGKTGVEKLIAQRDQIIKRLGAETDAVNRVTAAYAKMIKVEQERRPSSDSGGANVQALRGIRDLFEGRTAYGEVQLGKALGSLSGASFAIAGTAAALVGLAAAGHSAAESLAKTGVELKDMELRTGLSAREVSQFSFAAHAVGTEVTITERIMRGLSQALEDMGPSGSKARKTLADLGVSAYDTNGNMKSTSAILLQVSDAFAKLPPGVQLSKDALDLFKRVGIEGIPFLRELRENVNYFDSHNLPSPKQSEIDQWAGYNKELAAFTTNKAAFERTFLAPLGQGFMAALNFMMTGQQATGAQGARKVTGLERLISSGEATPGFRSNALPPPPSRSSSVIDAALWFAGSGGDSELRGNAARLKSFLGGSGNLESAQNQLAKLKTAYEETRTKAEQIANANALNSDIVSEQIAKVNAASKAYEHQRDVVKEIEKAESNRLAVTEALRRQSVDIAERLSHPYGMLPAESRLKGILDLPGITDEQKAQARRNAVPDVRREVEDILRKAGIQINAPTLSNIPSDVTRISPLTGGIARYSQSVGAVGRDEMQLKGAPGGFMAGVGELTAKGEAQVNALGHMMQEGIKELDKDARDGIKIAETFLTETRKFETERAMSQVKLAATLAPDTAANRLAAERAVADIKIKAAGEEFSANAARAAGDKNEALILKNLRLQYATEVNGVEQEYIQQQANEWRKQFDEIKGKTEGLLHTLFTNPKGFGSQLTSTLRDAALKPIESGLASTIASVIQPLVGRLGGMFGGSSRQVSIDGSGAALVRVVNLGGGGGAGTGIFSVGGFSGGGSTSTSTSSGGVAIPGSGGFSLPGFGGGTSVFGPSSITGGPGGTGGFAPGEIGLGGGGGGNSGGGSSLPGGGMLSNLKGLNLGGFTRDAGGSISGVSGLAGAGLISGGMGLAQSGLLGSHRGTIGGIFMGAAGGAAIGLSLGGPWGALVGAEVGALIGIGEKIAGVETPENEAKRLVKQIYRVSIDTDTAKQIVQIAKSQYANHVSVAVRSPEVRNLVMLYSQATGQGNLLSSTVPRAGGLQEMGGQLSQTASFVNGTAYAYQSSLPVAGGFNANVWPGGSSSPVINGLQISIGGQGAAQFMNGQIVTPENVQTTLSSAYAQSNNRVGTSALLNSPGLITG